tara:strand:+ start:918 stop:1337 length:420 start_codon:yes stop_codon:yes gene_type:complete
MIRFSLECAKGHVFDSWFGSNADYERLQDRGLVACSVCGDTAVSKAIMAPAVSLAEQQNAHPLSAPATPAEQALRELRKKFEAEATDVGKNFATQARKMHEGDLPSKPIYGEAKIEDARALLEDGIPVAPLPWQKRRDS